MKEKANQGMSMAEERRRIDAALKRKGLQYDPRKDRATFRRRMKRKPTIVLDTDQLSGAEWCAKCREPIEPEHFVIAGFGRQAAGRPMYSFFHPHCAAHFQPTLLNWRAS